MKREYLIYLIATAQAYYNLEKPDTMGPRWTLRCQVQFLFPK
jgi:hypothetical protein